MEEVLYYVIDRNGERLSGSFHLYEEAKEEMWRLHKTNSMVGGIEMTTKKLDIGDFFGGTKY